MRSLVREGVLPDRLFDVYTVRDGKCARKLEFREKPEALEAAGLRD
jgi:hypothetical protein